MLRLIFSLCGVMLLALIIWGQDRGQLRPGLAQAALEAERAALAPPVPVAPDPPPPVLATAPDLPEPPPEVAATAPPPYVEPDRTTVEALEEPVFSLANVGNEPVPGEDGTPPAEEAASAAPEVVPDEVVPGSGIESAIETSPELDPEPLNPDPASQPTGATIWYVAASSVNLRASPSTEADILTKLGPGEVVVVVEDIDGEWAQIVVQSDGLVGYVALRYLTPAVP